MVDDDLAAMRQFVQGLNCRPMFVTVSGAHSYGFPSSDSDACAAVTCWRCAMWWV